MGSVEEYVNKCVHEHADRIYTAEQCLKSIENQLHALDCRISKLEGQDQERFRHEITLIMGKH